MLLYLLIYYPVQQRVYQSRPQQKLRNCWTFGMASTECSW